ncbi:hypothetical protein GUJ93_ZPchr0001g30515 [Zizania palustris]|uniref:Uncharacterized protein n=1 Tax=Zizania palustris TaxID=103762 RepID=A0A8J5RPE9_ZIZPA|nr:hypothetical protein GUJ93_ZPchr0001g30515 [Zizania palustris]
MLMLGGRRALLVVRLARRRWRWRITRTARVAAMFVVLPYEGDRHRGLGSSTRRCVPDLPEHGEFIRCSVCYCNTSALNLLYIYEFISAGVNNSRYLQCAGAKDEQLSYTCKASGSRRCELVNSSCRGDGRTGAGMGGGRRLCIKRLSARSDIREQSDDVEWMKDVLKYQVAILKSLSFLTMRTV